MNPKIIDTYKIYRECGNKKDLYDKIANYYNDPTSMGKYNLIRYLAAELPGMLSQKISRANSVIKKIISPFNVYNPLREYYDEEVNIDFNDGDFHWL